MKKNVASQVIGAQMVSASDGSAFTGAVTVYVTGDGGAQGAGSVASGACAHEGNGFHTYVPAQAETNYDHIGFTFTGSGAIPATVQVYPTFPQTGDGFARLGAPAGASLAADVAAVKVDTAAVKLQTDKLTFTVANQIDANVLDWKSATAPAMTGDAFARLGAPAGASVSADVAAIQADTDNLQTRIPAALVSGRIDASVGAMAANVITAAATAADYLAEINAEADTAIADAGLATAANLATVAGYLDTEIAAILLDTNELQTDWANGGRLDNILDARASQTSVDDLPTNAELATALGTADDAVLAILGTPAGASLSADVAAVKAQTAAIETDTAEIGVAGAGLTVLATQASVNTIDDFVDTEVAAIKTDTAAIKLKTDNLPSDPADASDVAALINAVPGAVWDELVADHADAGSTGEALAAAAAAGDPWATLIPGAYGAGTAGKIVGDNVNATISSRATQTSVDDLPTNAELATALGTADDAVLARLGTPAGASIAADIAAVKAVDDAVKAKTDNLPSDPADASDIAGSFSTVNSTLGTIAGYIDTEIGAIYSRIGAPVGASISADIAAVKTQTAAIETDTGEIGAAGAGLTALASAANLATLAGYVDTEVGAIKAKTDNLPSDPADASDVAAGVAAVKLYADRTVIRGTVSATAPSTTTFTSSALSPAGVDADQFKGRIIVFDNDTLSTSLRGQATDVTANSAAANPLFTFSALTTAPQAGDTFSIL